MFITRRVATIIELFMPQFDLRLPAPRLLLIDYLIWSNGSYGQLLLATPFTWLNEFTPREKWLGSVDFEEKLKHLLESQFRFGKRLIFHS